MVFIDIPTNCIQHEFFIHFFGTAVIEPPEVFVFFDVPKVTFRLNAQSDFDFQFMIFYDDNTFQGIYTRSKNHKSYSGTYAIERNGLTLNYSDVALVGAIIDDGDSVQFGDVKFTDWTGDTSEDDSLYDEFVDCQLSVHRVIELLEDAVGRERGK